MPQMLRELIVILDQIGIVVGLILAVPVFWTWYEIVFGKNARRRQALAQIKAEQGTRPSMLIVDLLEGKDVRASVELFRSKTAQLKAVPDQRVFYVNRSERIKPEQMVDLVDDIRATASKIVAAGTDTLHLFYAGPTIAAAIVGCEFGNACRTLLYQHAQGDYENWGPLRLTV